MKIYGTTELSYQIEQLLKEDTKLLIIVSPYLKLNKRLRAKMIQNFNRSEIILFLYRKNELNNDEYSWLRSFSNVQLIPVENLHAKIYLNENSCLITSMNLYEYSQINNHEIGVMIEIEKNRQEFLEVLDEIKLMIDSQGLDFNFENIFSHTTEYAFREFYNQAMDEFGIKRDRYSGGYYENFCSWARTIVSFKPEELYQDNTAILRSTVLDRKRYEKLKSEMTVESFTKRRRL